VENEPFCYTIDSGKNSVGTIPGLEKCFNLNHIENPDIAAVSQMNYGRTAA
jgi:hypothetical protein